MGNRDRLRSLYIDAPSLAETVADVGMMVATVCKSLRQYVDELHAVALVNVAVSAQSAAGPFPSDLSNLMILGSLLSDPQFHPARA